MKNINKFILFSALALVLISLCPALMFTSASSKKNPTVEAFSVKCVSGQTKFYEGQSFSSDGYEGTLFYSDGTKQTLPATKLKYTVADPLIPSSGNLTYVDFSCSETSEIIRFPIEIIPMTGLQVLGSYKTSYNVGEECLDISHMEISTTYSNGNFFPVDTSKCTFSIDPSLPLTSNDTTITVSYTLGEHTVSTQISVNLKKVSSIRVKSFPDKKFYEGDYFTCSKSELEVYALYEGETEEVKVDKWNILTENEQLIANSEGKCAVTVEFGGKTADFYVETVKITQTTATRKSVYNLYIGDIFNPEGIKVTAVFADGTEKTVTQNVEFVYPDTIVSGSVIKAFYAGTEIQLSEIVIVHTGTLAVIKQPEKTEYKVGDKFDPTGLIAVFTYDDGKTVRLTVSDLKINVTEILTETDSIAEIEWNGYKAECTFSVFSDVRIKRIEIVTQPTTLRYITGQPINIDGIEVKVYYDGVAEGELVDASKLVTVPEIGSPITANMHSYIVRYKISETVYYDATQIIEVTEKTPKALIVTSLPAIDKFYEGSVFNPDGLAVNLVYNDGTVLQVTDYTLSQGEDPFVLSSNETFQDVSITVSYAGFETSFKVTVLAKKVKSLTLLSPPLKTVYRIGESFDPTGMKVLLTYTDTTITPVLLKDTDYIVTPTGKLTSTDNRAYVTFRGFTVSIDLEVNASGVHQETSAAVTTDDPLIDITTVNIDTGAPTPITSYTPYTTPSTPADDTTKTPTPVTTSGSSDTTPGGSSRRSGINTITVLWIIVIAVMFIGIIALIFYYRRHFM